MAYSITRVEIWAGDVFNRPRMLAQVLKSLSGAGAKLEFVTAQRLTPTTGRVYLAPLKGVKQRRAAQDAGLVIAQGMQSIRIEGPDRAGLGADLAHAVADAGLNINGLSGAIVGRRCVLYLAFGTAPEATKAAKVAREFLRAK